MIRFNFFTFLIAAAAVTLVVSLPQDLFSLPEPSFSGNDDFLPPLEISSDIGNSFLDDNNINNNDDLFTDFTANSPTDLISSGVDELDSFDELRASCPSENRQAPSKVRARDAGVCAPNNQPSPIDGFIDNVLGIFGDPSDREEELQGAADAAATKSNTASPCFNPKHPVHLCCAFEGEESNTVLFRPFLDFRREIFETMEDCQPGMYIRVVVRNGSLPSPPLPPPFSSSSSSSLCLALSQLPKLMPEKIILIDKKKIFSITSDDRPVWVSASSGSLLSISVPASR